MKGRLITFEGGDGGGKTTLIRSIKEALEAKGLTVLSTREPGGTPLGESIRTLVLNTPISIHPMAELLLFLSSRVQHLEEVIKPALKKGVYVLCDRFNDSSMAYQGVARQLGLEKVEDLCRLATDPFEPDLTFYLDIDPKIGLQRASQVSPHDRLEQEKLDFHQRVQEGFLLLCQRFPHRIHKLDATHPPNAVFKEAFHILEPLCTQF